MNWSYVNEDVYSEVTKLVLINSSIEARTELA